MKFKVGDRVRVKQGLVTNNSYGNLSLFPDMKQDDVMTIKHIYNDVYYTGRFYYSAEMLELATDTPSIREVKRPAKVGEWIRVIDGVGHLASVGEIHKVIGLSVNYSGWVYIDAGVIKNCLRNTQYVVLENYQPKPKSLADYTNK